MENNYLTPDEKQYIKEEPLTPGEDYKFGENTFDYDFENTPTNLRKSLSASDIRRDLENYRFKAFLSRKPCNSNQELCRNKFVSLAESVYHFERDTPGRYHSSRSLFQPQLHSRHLELTVPQSPMLICKQRSRPPTVVSQKEKEEMEWEEIKKYKVKAKPIPKSVIEGTQLPEVQKKPLTIFEPFNLTEVHKKLPSYSPVQPFKARPAPKHILENPQIPPKPPVTVTHPVSPKFHYRRSQSQDHLKNVSDSKDKQFVMCYPRHGPLQVEPFSFTKRDEEIKKKKEDKIKRLIEEEKKLAYQFKAQPLPGIIKKNIQKCNSGHSSTTSSENKENNNYKFEARPPLVLHKDPFKPILKQCQPIKPVPFALSSEKRATEREKFDKHLREKEEECEKRRLEREAEQKKLEEKTIAELRLKLVHHPKPLVQTAQFVPEKNNIPLTVPETPKFVRRLKHK